MGKAKKNHALLSHTGRGEIGTGAGFVKMEITVISVRKIGS